MRRRGLTVIDSGVSAIRKKIYKDLSSTDEHTPP